MDAARKGEEDIANDKNLNANFEKDNNEVISPNTIQIKNLIIYEGFRNFIIYFSKKLIRIINRA